MQAQKLSISLPKEQYAFMENYRTKHHCKSRSAVIEAAICLLQKAELASCYREANEEINDDFEITTLDGIEEDETW
jgi:antitoxin ParD1/3/4